MDFEHIISDELLKEIQSAVLRNDHWLAYNTINYFLGEPDVYFFRNKDEAEEFSDSNISEYDDFRVIHFLSVEEVFKQITHGEFEFQNNILSHKKSETMNEQNFDYLAKQLKYTGFGEELQRDLREKMSEGQASFNLAQQFKFGETEVSAMLQFKKSEQSDMYFFNRYFLQLPGEKKEEALAQSFRIDRENNITLKEGFNLLQGRAVYKELQPKEGEKYHAWLQLNFKESNEYGDFKMKQFHDNYGYRITDTLARYPIKELENSQSSESLLKSLERGNRQQVTMIQDGKETKMFIEANPQFKSLNVYNAEGLRENVQAQKLLQGEKQSEKQSEKLQQKEGMAEGEKKTKRQSQKQVMNGQENGTAKHVAKQSRKVKQNLS
ncbi:MAG: hypothetical protein JST87_04790 [Bacteroidetes bacterium]|nr:hypothetical protein [Bacteroidota bacterium]